MGCDDKIIDIEDVNKKLDAHIATSYKKPNLDEIIFFKPMIDSLLKDVPYNTLRKIFHYSHKRSFLFQIFLIIRDETGIYTEADFEKIRSILKIKDCKSNSGIISITVFTSPYPEYIDDEGNVVVQSFSCQWNCSYCPNEPGQPRSYLKGEPGVLRANRENFKCIEQMFIRLEALYVTGHDIDKLEVLVLGGTWTSYPLKYREQFVRDIYYAANNYKYNINQKEIRKPLSLIEEKSINKNSRCKVIGLTLETRPDTISASEIKLFRYYGCTRIQLGIQHSDNEILKMNNRKCSIETTIKSIELLKNCGYKIDGHWMPNLPGSTIQKDEELFENLLGIKSKKYINLYHEVIELKCPELQVDQWKIYPTTITEFTDIKKWYENGEYIPYSNELLFELLIKVKKLVFPWIRLNRVIRDIPNDYVPQLDYHSNAREFLQKQITIDGWYCSCQRCREVKGGVYDHDNSETVIRNYNASNGEEYFISKESKDKRILYGFVRLRMSKDQATTIFPELEGAATIRELHVYGTLQIVEKPLKNKTKNENCEHAQQNKNCEHAQQNKNCEHAQQNKNCEHAQHKGIGKMLMNKAEEIAKSAKYAKMAVIAGEGTRGYYEKLGYSDSPGEGFYMIKNL